jgi:N-acetyl-alpha-D-muramate 1-phosphate uridylyltransferase
MKVPRYSRRLLPVVILAGGLATRLRPLTEDLPKSLVDVNGQPFIAHQLRLLRTQGVNRVIVCAGYRGELIQQFVGSGAAFGLEVRFAFDGPQLLGTAGAVKNAWPLVGPAGFVLYGDSFLECDYQEVQMAFERCNQLGLMTVFHNENRWDRSNVEFVDGRIVAYDKHVPTTRMRHIDYGLAVFQAAAFTGVQSDRPSELATLYQRLLAQGQLGGWEVPQRFYEIGSWNGLEETRRHLAEHAPRARGMP